ncbi:MAG: hypothetical protein JWM58_3748 [Rhizobium sp.]|nr:hypothetical protein [Rhizobium sp.]
MSANTASVHRLDNMPYYQERVDLAAAFRWTARLNMHEAVANHFSLAVNDDGSQFLMNPNQVHFSLLKASSLLLLDANDPKTMDRPDAPDPTAWGLHGAIHRHLPRARCLMHVHSIHATVLASLADSRLLPIDQNCATFFNRYVIDENYGGLAFEDEGARCARLLSNPLHKVMIMGSHGVLVIGKNVADTFNRMYYFERAAETYIKALMTGQKLRVLSDEIADKVAQEIEDYPGQAERHLSDLKTLLERQEPDFMH